MTVLVMFSSLFLVCMVGTHSAQRKGGVRHSECFLIRTDSMKVTLTWVVCTSWKTNSFVSSILSHFLILYLV